MVSHESLAGHGHVQAAWLEAIGLVHDGGSDIGSGERVCHWTLPLVLALACVLFLALLVDPSPNFFEHVFCFACLCWALASGRCPEDFNSGVGHWKGRWTVVCVCCMAKIVTTRSVYL